MQNLLKPLLALKTKQGYSVLTVVVVTLFSVWALLDATKVEVVLAVDGEEQTIKTNVKTVGELLDDAGVDFEKYDHLSHEENVEIENGMEIKYNAANKINLTIDDKTEEFHTTAKTVGEFFDEQELDFSKHDQFSHNEMALIEDEMELKIDTAFLVKVIDGKKTKKVWTTGGTVKEVLADNDIKFKKKYKIKPSLNKELSKNTTVKITHVKEKDERITETIPFETKEREDSSLEKGKTEIVQNGKTGSKTITYQVVYENGEEVSREQVAEDVTEEPVEKIIKIGTKQPKVSEAQQTKAAPVQNTSAPSQGGKTYTMEATAYGPDCAGCSGITATGINIKSGTQKVIAVDPSVIPLGSRVWVEGYGEAIAGDTGGAIKGNRIDVLVPSEAYAASNWGRRTVQVKVLD